VAPSQGSAVKSMLQLAFKQNLRTAILRNMNTMALEETCNVPCCILIQTMIAHMLAHMHAQWCTSTRVQMYTIGKGRDENVNMYIRQGSTNHDIKDDVHGDTNHHYRFNHNIDYCLRWCRCTCMLLHMQA